MPYDEAIAASGRRRSPASRSSTARSAVGVLGGASLTTEKAYLLGKFARVCLKTPYIDYNGRLCMVSAGAANKKAFGIDRTTNPWSDMVGTDVIWVGGVERRRVLADHHELHLAGARARREGHRVRTRASRRSRAPAISILPVQPGPRRRAVRRRPAPDDRERAGSIASFIAEHTVGFEQVAEYCREWTPAPHRRGDRRARAVDPRRPRSCGARRRRASSSTRAASSTTRTACRTPRHDQPRARLRAGSASRSAATATIVGQAQRPGRARARAEVRSAPRLARHREPRAPPLHRRRCGASTRARCPGRASTPTSCSARSTRARSRA